MTQPVTAPIRLLVVARQAFSVSDASLEDLDGVESVQVIRRPKNVATALAGSQANLALIDTGFTDRRGFGVMSSILAEDPTIAVLALTQDPPTYEEVALATRAGARGFVDVDAEPPELTQALHAVHAGGIWFPAPESRALFDAVGGQLDVTSQERRSRLFGLALGLVPLTGAIAAVLSLTWRRYVGQIGVRPVDMGIDPGSRVADTLAAMLLVLGVLGPLLFVSHWLEMLRGSQFDRGPGAWLLKHRRTAWLVLASMILAITLLLARGPDALLVLVIGPTVAVAAMAGAFGLTDEIPEVMRLETLKPGRMLVGGTLAAALFFGFLVFESMMVGPDLRTDGAHGWLAPKVLGFKAQPMQAFNVDTGEEPRELLYLGGNADLYVLVDPCNDDEVKFVSVGATRLVVIDEITCNTDS